MRTSLRFSAWRVPARAPASLPRRPRARAAARDALDRVRGVHTSATLGEGSRVLKHIGEHHSRQFAKCTIDELLNLKDASESERLARLENVLHVGLSKIVVLLQCLPMGLGCTDAIRSIIEDYIRDLKDLLDCSHSDQDRFRECIHSIFVRHRGLITQLPTGLQQFQADIASRYEPFGGLQRSNLADVSQSVPAIRQVELALDEFFTIRTTLRLLTAHCMHLHPESANSDVSVSAQKLISELLVVMPDRLLDPSRHKRTHVGVVCMDTRPSVLLTEAYRRASEMCRRRFRRASELFINDMPWEEYLAREAQGTSLEAFGSLDADMDEPQEFQYIDVHLYFVFFEVLRNALFSSIRKASPDQQPPPIHASIIAGTSLLLENERSVKIRDEGEGIGRDDVRKVWSYFYSTKSARVDESRVAGLGLPVSRQLVRYFGGEIHINSLPRKGTDVNIYL